MRADIHMAVESLEGIFGDFDMDTLEQVEQVLHILHSAAYDDGFADGQCLNDDDDEDWGFE